MTDTTTNNETLELPTINDDRNDDRNDDGERLIDNGPQVIMGARFHGDKTLKDYLPVAALFLLCVMCILAIAAISMHITYHDNAVDEEEPPLTPQQVAKCVADHRKKYNPSIPGRGRSPLNSKGDFVLTNVTVWTAREDGLIRPNTNVVVRNGKIRVVDDFADDSSISNRIDGKGLILTPGIVDMHSHAGVYAWPEIWATSDGNEMTNPITSQVRAIDAFDPEDLAIPHILAGGVTTAQVLPGSGNVMGGEGALFKMRGKKVADMFVPSMRILKMACGENPKRFYGGKGQMPESRMGSAWLMRQRFDNARKLMEAQERWCSAVERTGTFPYDLELESLVSLLRGEAVLNVHCYQVQDFEMILRLSSEFDFRVAAFHHALEAYKIPDEIRRAGITVATFSDLWGYKYEAYDASVHAPSILRKHNVKVALKSDHPVLDANTMMYEAAKAHHYGLNEWDALRAVTAVPAAAIGMDKYLGTVEVGKDADLVLWDRHPLLLGAKPLKVLVNGELLVDLPTNASPASSSKTQSEVSMNAQALDGCDNVVETEEYALVGMSVMLPNGALVSNQRVVVSNGSITCMSTLCDISGMPAVRFTNTVDNVAIMSMGFVDAGSGIGLLEIDAEGTTQDGTVSGSGASGHSGGIQIEDGVRIVSRHVRAAWSAGILTSIAHPQGSQVLGGLSTAFRTCHSASCPESIDDLIVDTKVAVHISVGNQAKDSGIAASISGEVEALRLLFDSALKYENATTALSDVPRDFRSLVRALRQEIPVVAEVYQADNIAAVVRLAKEFGFRLTILGGAEAGVVTQLLASSNEVEGVLIQASTPPSTFDTMRFKRGDIAKLQAAGVKVGLYVADPDNGRNLRFEAGLAIEAGLAREHAYAAITTNVLDMFGIPWQPLSATTGPTSFVIFNGDPMSLASQTMFVARGRWAHCNPKQF